MKLNVFMAYLAFCALFWQFEMTNSRTSTMWRLNIDEGRITSRIQNDNKENNVFNSESGSIGSVYPNDDVFNIITSTISDGSSWSKQISDCSTETCDTSALENASHKGYKLSRMPQQLISSKNDKKTTRSESSTTMGATTVLAEETLDCGKPVNFTYYDYLIGVAQRFNHPLIPEPEVAFIFLKNKDEKSLKNFDISALEKRLKKAKRDRPRSVHLYNQIGNYFRIVGDARQAIECFRRALAMSPTNAEVLLNLARVLYNLQYLDDAIHLTRRSLEVQPPDRSAWRQYFTLGEIFKAYGHFQESVLHLRHALELYPQHEPILKVLRDVENSPSSTLHFYTIIIIAALVVAVFIVIITSSNASDGVGGSGSIGSHSDSEPKMQRHFNRAMAMRSLKGLSSRTCKQRKY